MISARRQAASAARREHWARIISEAEASGLPVRTFCQQRELNENLFYHWRRVLELEGPKREVKEPEGGFVLVKARKAPEQTACSTEPANLELITERGWRLRISAGIDEALLRTVLAALAARA